MMRILIPATFLLAEFVTMATIPLATLESLPHWFIITAAGLTLLAILSPIIPVGKKR
ncbi:MAG TPA: hypothetical protein VNG51_01330 [Ktedonobacteraceae bacterium]|nr:hypothetical protein [Ktedonobacteraceae bacterium]